ncbi:mechanosensitive ion channel [Arenibacter sp. GZD96]|uniref:mechanosensitive ion channel family protein n=1 Tax=Aurantibrevibacter litoralis TaxID=3106030 RepID=UPI002AFF7951|nr:mechanosensitive ion channel domain-containing protein [Arenibacter sp. GZD-96]MEA1785356.1 mechanosensitive ion channel [Arenibacter sp. GZD-96]
MLKKWLTEILSDFQINPLWIEIANAVLLLIALLFLIFFIDFILRKLILSSFTQFAKRTETKFDDIVIQNKVPRNIAHIVPFLLALEFVPTVFSDFPYVEILVEKALWVFAIVLLLWLVRSVLNACKDYLKTLDNFKQKPIDSYVQVFMIFIWVLGIFSAIAILTEIKFVTFITSLGAVSAVILLIFKDTLLGFVASIQVSINDMVRIGDWITFEKYGADGDVIEINLATVKVQNFDKTITTIPTYALISDSFKNWRGMSESGGRRIRRAINIRMKSIKYLTETDVDRLRAITIIADYLHHRQTEIKNYNHQQEIDKTLLLNGRNLTNLGVFRKYIESYIQGHSAINKDMMIMTRQLAPTTQGIPLEIYAFSADKRWQNYEYIMADIFDHIIAAVPYFDLEIFELQGFSQDMRS